MELNINDLPMSKDNGRMMNDMNDLTMRKDEGHELPTNEQDN